MLTLGNQVRLDTLERKQLASLTGSTPDHIKNRDQLRTFVQAHLVNYPGRDPAEVLLRRMLESFLPG